MKRRLETSAEDFVRVIERLDNVADILGLTVDPYGIVITVRKGLAKSAVEKHTITYSIARSPEGYVITFRLSNSLDPITRVQIKSTPKGCELETKCVGDKVLCRYVDEMIERMTENIRMALEKLKKATMRLEARAQVFSITPRYAKVIDGLAEVTLSSLYLKYPLLDRRIVSIDEVKDLDTFLNKLYKLYSSRTREVYVHVGAERWMLILAIDFVNKEYTPSFIENRTRLIGKEAIEMFKKMNDPYVVVTVLTMHS